MLQTILRNIFIVVIELNIIIKMILKCIYCGYVFNYNGTLRNEVVCPKCNRQQNYFKAKYKNKRTGLKLPYFLNKIKKDIDKYS